MSAARITSITKGPRQSNFELLRLFAMFLVLVVHSDFWTLGRPTIADFSNQPITSLIKVMIESASVVCVNCFILISGWFGIRATLKGFCGFIFQCLYFIIGLYIIAIAIGRSSISVNGISECLLLTPNSWFIHSYVILYIISPVLNLFLEKADQKVITGVLIAFFIYQSSIGWLNASSSFMGGYSALSFCGLYTLAGYTRKYLNISKLNGGGLYMASIVINTAIYYGITYFGIPVDAIAYLNPFIILGAIGLLLHFSKIKINSNRFINWAAASAFAVYLFHTETQIGVQIFKSSILTIFNNFNGILFIALIFLTLIAYFIIAILLDQPRKFAWRLISDFFK